MISTQPLFTAIKNECGSLFSTEAHSDPQILGYIGSAIRYIANYRDFPFLKKQITVTVISPDTAVTTAYKVKTHTVYFGTIEKIPLPIDEYFMPNTTPSYVGSWDDVFYAKRDWNILTYCNSNSSSSYYRYWFNRFTWLPERCYYDNRYELRL